MSILTPQASDVYISEVNFSQTLTQVANAIACQVIVSGQGPLGPRFWTDANDYLAAYGNADATVSFDQYCAIDYFRWGSGIWANRVVENDARYAAAVIGVAIDGTTFVRPINSGIAQSELTYPNWNTYVASGETPIYVVYAENGPGSYANSLALSFKAGNLTQVTGLAATSTSTGGNLGPGTYTYAVSALTSSGAETLISTPAAVVISSSPTTNQVTLTWTPVVGAVGYRVYGRDSQVSTMGLLTTVGASTPTWIDDGLDTPSASISPIISPANVTLSQGFTLSVFNTTISTSTPVEKFACTLLDGVDATGSPTETSQKINPYSQNINVLSYVPSLTTLPVLSDATSLVSLNGGTSGSAPSTATVNTGFGVFSNKSKYVIDTIMNAGRAVPVVQQAIDSLAQTRSDCVGYLDTPAASQTFEAAIDYRNVTLNLNSSYSALFTPDLLESDPISGKLLFVPPSGMMCGLFANTTNLAQPWFSMAGLNRGLLKCLDVRYTYEDSEMTPMFQAQVNYMKKYQGAGIVLAEQSTLASQSSALQFLNVRALCNTIKRAAYSFLIYGLQDPLDEILELALTTGLNSYLEVVQSGRGISSFDVYANAGNNPPLLANSGILAIAIIIVPILAVQRIQLTLGISKQGLTISEATIAAVSL